MVNNFYDKVAQKFGGYGYGNGTKPQYKNEYLAGDSEKDKNYLKVYVSKFKTDKGIKLSRHRVVLVAQK